MPVAKTLKLAPNPFHPHRTLSADLPIQTPTP